MLVVQGGAPSKTGRAGDFIFQMRRMLKKRRAILTERSTQSLNRLSLGEEGVMT